MIDVLRCSSPTMRRVGMGAFLIGVLGIACSGPRPEPEKSSPPSRVYRVQVRMTEKKEQAVRARTQARQWWESQPPSERPSLVEGIPSSTPPVTIDWKPPFYRVRLGPFASRAEAESVLEAVRSTFPDAFVAPKRVDSQ